MFAVFTRNWSARDEEAAVAAGDRGAERAPSAGVALYLGDTVPVGKDENSYSLLAQRLATGHGYSFPPRGIPLAG